MGGVGAVSASGAKLAGPQTCGQRWSGGGKFWGPPRKAKGTIIRGRQDSRAPLLFPPPPPIPNPPLWPEPEKQLMLPEKGLTSLSWEGLGFHQRGRGCSKSLVWLWLLRDGWEAGDQGPFPQAQVSGNTPETPEVGAGERRSPQKCTWALYVGGSETV